MVVAVELCCPVVKEVLAARDLSASPHPTAKAGAWLAPCYVCHGLEISGNEALLTEVVVPVLHPPPDENVFPTVQSEAPHPQLVAIIPNITYSC